MTSWATVNGLDVLPKMELSDAALVLTRDLGTNEELKRGDFLPEPRHVAMVFPGPGTARDARLHAHAEFARPAESETQLPRRAALSPTDVKPTADGRGSMLTYRLDHALSHKGMGIALPTLPQPGAATNAVLGEAETRLDAYRGRRCYWPRPWPKCGHAPLLSILVCGGSGAGVCGARRFQRSAFRFLGNGAHRFHAADCWCSRGLRSESSAR